MNDEIDPLPERVSDPIAEQNDVGALVGGLQGEAQSETRIVVRVTRCATRPLDRDNNAWGSVKPLVDSLRDTKLIPDDDEKTIRLEVFQEKVAHRKDEGTRIEIIWPETIPSTT